MNEGVVFTRCYTVLKDRDITGELKEVWMAVQVKRDREQESQQETWIDVQPPAPQYPQFEMSPEYSYQTSNNDQVYQSGPHMVPQQYHGNIQPQINQEQYSYPERGRQNQGQQNCPAYPTPQYQFQQLPRQLVPQYINSNIHPNVGSNYVNQGVVNTNVNPNIPGHYQQYIALQQQMVGQRQLENVMHAVRETHTDLQQSQMHVPHMQYEQPPPFSLPNSMQMNVLRLGRPHMGVTQKSNANKRQTGSPTHSKQTNPGPRKDGGDKSPTKGSRMRILRDHRTPDKQNQTDKGEDEVSQNVQVTDLDEELEESKTHEATNGQKIPKRKKEIRQQILNSSDEITVLESNLPLEGTEDNAPNQDLSSKPLKTQILVLKRSSKTNNNESKGSNSKPIKNAIRLTKLDGQQIYDLESERDRIGNKEEGNQGAADAGEKKPTDNGGRNGFAHKQQQKDRPKRFQTVNNIINNVFKIHPSTSSDEKTKSNGKNENDDVYHGYAILMKGEANQEDVTSEIAQISIKDCDDTADQTAVNS